MGRYLGLDYGQRRLGFALSDPTGMLATPFRVVIVKNDQEALQAVINLCRETNAASLVIGLPLHLDGGLSELANRVKAFQEKLTAHLNIPILLWDERLTTHSAERVLIEAGTRREKRRAVIDKLAAQIMLQHFLDSRHPETA